MSATIDLPTPASFRASQPALPGSLRHRTQRFSGLVSVAGLLFAWWAATAYGLVSPVVLPGPPSVIAAFVRVWGLGYAGAPLLAHVAASMMRLVIAFAVAVVIGVPLGLAMGAKRAIRELVGPWIELYRPVPSLAYMSLLVIWLGVGDSARVVLLVLGGLPAVVIGTAQAVGSIRTERIQGARSLGIERLSMFRMIILPSCLPDILTSLRIASSGIFTTLIAAEMIGANLGLGSMLLAASYQMEMSVVILAVLILGTAGLLIDRCFRRLQLLLTPWAGRF